jgi:thiamine kinase-like enzyme
VSNDRVHGPPVAPSPDWLRNIVSEFALGRVSVSPILAGGGGSADRVWKVLTNQGTWAVKESVGSAIEPPDTERISSGMLFEREAWEHGIPMPEPRLTVGGAPLLEVRAGTSECVVTVREWIDGTPVGWNENAAEREPAALLLAAGLARLHGVQWSTARPISDWWKYSPGFDRWTELERRARYRNAPWIDGLEEAILRLEGAEAIIATYLPPSTVGMCHLDANPHNVLRTRGGIKLIDWDGAGLASPDQEIASVLATWACDGNGMPMDGLPNRMLAAYLDAGGSCVSWNLGVFIQHLTGWLNWIELQMAIALGLRPDDPRTRSQADQSVRDLFVWTRRLDGLQLLLDMLEAGA